MSESGAYRLSVIDEPIIRFAEVTAGATCGVLAITETHLAFLRKDAETTFVDMLTPKSDVTEVSIREDNDRYALELITTGGKFTCSGTGRAFYHFCADLRRELASGSPAATTVDPQRTGNSPGIGIIPSESTRKPNRRQWLQGCAIAVGVLLAVIIIFIVARAILDGTGEVDTEDDSATRTIATATPVPLSITASELYEAREANATRFDQTYKGKRVEVTGVVASVEGGEIRLRVDSSFFGDVRLHDLPEYDQIKANRGEGFRAVCSVGNYILGSMMLRDCSRGRVIADSSSSASNAKPADAIRLTSTPTRQPTPTKPPAPATVASAVPQSPDLDTVEVVTVPPTATDAENDEIQSAPENEAPAAAVPAETAEPEAVDLPSFGPGTYLVGDHIQPGIYRAEVASSFFPLCTWSRLSGLDGSLGSIIATKIINEGSTYVRIRETDLAFESTGCTEFAAFEPTASTSRQFGSGTYVVGSDIHPGLYKSRAKDGLLPFCIWSRLSDVDASLGSLIATDIVVGGQVLVEIAATDFAFESSGCQTWVLQGEPVIAPSESPNARVATASPTAIFSPTNTPTVTATVPSASVHTPTGTATPTATSLPTVTATPTSESTPTATQIPTPSPSPTPGPTDTPTPTVTPSPTPEPPSTPAELMERVQNSVVRVKARSGGTFFGRTSQGSGFIFAVEGTTAFIATNHHVIDGSNSVEVQIGDSSTYDALVLGWDAERDVAVVSICCSSDFIALPWGRASPSEGESVIAIGYPNSDTGNLIATIGEVRAPDDLSMEHDFIPHSAPLNPGNSGGPLFSMPGAEVIGINTASGTETLAFYAVPYQAIAQQVADWRSQLIVDATATPTPTTTKPANTLFRVKLSGVIYTIHSVIDPAPERSSLSPGERAVAIDVSIEAVETSTDYDEDDFIVQDSDGYIYEPDWLNRGIEPDLGSGTLAAGQRIRGWVNFNVTEQARLIAIQVETGYGSPRVVIADLTSD